MDYKKAQEDYKFKRFGKNGAIYKVLNHDGIKKLLIIKKINTSFNNNKGSNNSTNNNRNHKKTTSFQTL